MRWHERYLVVYSQSLAEAAIRGQQQRINQAIAALNALSSKAAIRPGTTGTESRKHSQTLPC